ncbi:RNA-dependent RNA polymerase [viral metagenome]|uniref:RNA-dependent RNA polymerase n=1 Tax=viral metagenome TaxID=1070528 RepID=A0A6L2ZJD8_9ZZZZ
MLEAKRWKPLKGVYGIGYGLNKPKSDSHPSLFWNKLLAVSNINEGVFPVRMRKIKYITHFDPRVVGGWPSILKYTIKWPGGKPVENGVINAAHRAALPLPTSKICKWVGVWRRPLGFRKSKLIWPSRFFQGFMLKNEWILSAWLQMEKVVMTGGWDSNWPNLKYMAIDNEHKYTYDELLSGLESRCHIDLKLPICKKPVEDDIDYLKINEKAYPGVIMSEFFGHNRRVCRNFSVSIAKDMFRRASKRIIRDMSFWSCGGREKPVKLTSGEFRTRLICMPEDPSMRVASTLSTPITEGLREVADGGLFICRTFESGRYKFFRTLFEGHKLVCDSDWSKFDNYVYEELMVTAMGICRSCFPEDEYIDNLFIFSLSNIIFKNIVLPDGNIFQINKGLPSGSPFTSLLGTVMNWLIWSTILSKRITDQNVLNATNVTCCGDDTLLTFPHDTCYGLKLDDEVKLCGLQNDGVDHLIRPAISVNYSHMPHFLKKRISKEGLPSWDMSDILSNLIFPPRDTTYVSREGERAKMLMYIAPFNLEVVKLLDNYRKFCLTSLQKEFKYISGSVLEDGLRRIDRSMRVAWGWFLSEPDPYMVRPKSDDDWVYANRRAVRAMPQVNPGMGMFGLAAFLAGEDFIQELMSPVRAPPVINYR